MKTHRGMEAYVTPAVGGGGLVASRPSCLIVGKMALGTNGIEDWAEPRASLNVVKREISSTRRESNLISPV
jgi:hypothetical protein